MIIRMIKDRYLPILLCMFHRSSKPLELRELDGNTTITFSNLGGNTKLKKKKNQKKSQNHINLDFLKLLKNRLEMIPTYTLN